MFLEPWTDPLVSILRRSWSQRRQWSLVAAHYSSHMHAWGQFEAEQGAFAEVVKRLFETGRHKTIATLRKDGSPRISGIECTFEQGRLTFGSMPGSRKLADLRRDPRFALHSPSIDPIEGDEATWPGEAKIAGSAVHVGAIEADGAPPGELFTADISEVVVVHLDGTGTKLVVEWWTPTAGLRRVERE